MVFNVEQLKRISWLMEKIDNDKVSDYWTHGLSKADAKLLVAYIKFLESPPPK